MSNSPHLTGCKTTSYSIILNSRFVHSRTGDSSKRHADENDENQPPTRRRRIDSDASPYHHTYTMDTSNGTAAPVAGPSRLQPETFTVLQPLIN